MQLQEFITETLGQIVKGIKNAQENLKDTGVLISPEGILNNDISKPSLNRGIDHGHVYVDLIEFEVVLTASEINENKKGVGVLFASIGAGFNDKKELSSVAVTNVKFTIPLIYPKP